MGLVFSEHVELGILKCRDRYTCGRGGLNSVATVGLYQLSQTPVSEHIYKGLRARGGDKQMDRLRRQNR